jgi:hypothetical protein
MLAQTAVTISPIGCVVENNAIFLKDPLAKPDLNNPWLFTSTP